MAFWGSLKKKLRDRGANSKPLVISESDLKPIEECLTDVPSHLRKTTIWAFSWPSSPGWLVCTSKVSFEGIYRSGLLWSGWLMSSRRGSEEHE